LPHSDVTQRGSPLDEFARYQILGARRVEILRDSPNRPRIGVAQRAGCVLEGQPRNAEVGAGGKPADVEVFSMIL